MTARRLRSHRRHSPMHVSSVHPRARVQFRPIPSSGKTCFFRAVRIFMSAIINKFNFRSPHLGWNCVMVDVSGLIRRLWRMFPCGSECALIKWKSHCCVLFCEAGRYFFVSSARGPRVGFWAALCVYIVARWENLAGSLHAGIAVLASRATHFLASHITGFKNPPGTVI